MKFASRLSAINTNVNLRSPMAGGRSEFVYDGLSRLRISRYYVRNANTNALELQNEKRRVYDGMDIVQERDGNNVTTASLTRAGNIGGILARTTGPANTASIFYGYDGGGNVTNLTNNAGAQVGSYTYDAFGNTVATSGVAASENPYRFSTKEAIGGLYSYGLRFYSPGLGRWINRDPIGEAGGANLYLFAGNDPINTYDDYGMIPNKMTLAQRAGGRQYMRSFFCGTYESARQGAFAAADGANPFGDPFADRGAYNRNESWVGWSQGGGAVAGTSLTVAGGLATGGYGLALGSAGTEAAIIGSLPARTGLSILLTHPAVGAAGEAAIAGGLSSALSGEDAGQVFNNTVQGGAIGGGFKSAGKGIPWWAVGSGKGLVKHLQKGNKNEDKEGHGCNSGC